LKYKETGHFFASFLLELCEILYVHPRVSPAHLWRALNDFFSFSFWGFLARAKSGKKLLWRPINCFLFLFLFLPLFLVFLMYFVYMTQVYSHTGIPGFTAGIKSMAGFKMKSPVNEKKGQRRKWNIFALLVLE
jgi:hypothetical protein